MFPPKTANLFGVMPHSAILNKMADKAMPFTRMVTMANANSSQIPTLFSEFFDVSAIENRIIAITPINSKLNIKRNSRSW